MSNIENKNAKKAMNIGEDVAKRIAITYIMIHKTANKKINQIYGGK